MALEAVIYNKEGRAIGDVRGMFDRAWLLNGYEQCTFRLSVREEKHRLDDFLFGNYLCITDTDLPIWGGYFDPEQPWSTQGIVTMNAYSGERIFEHRCATGDRLLTGTAGVIFRQIVQSMNTVLPWSTLVRVGNIYEGGASREETITAKKFYDDVLRISSRSGNDWQVEPVVENGVLHFDAHWFKQRGEVKDFALEEGVNVEAKENVLEYQGEIWNYIFAFGNGSTWDDRAKAVAFDQVSIDKYGPRMYPLAVDAQELATVKASAESFLATYAYPRRTFNLTVGGKRIREEAQRNVYQVVRVGDTVDLLLPSVGYDNGKVGVETRVRIMSMTHRAGDNVLDLIANEVRS